MRAWGEWVEGVEGGTPLFAATVARQYGTSITQTYSQTYGHEEAWYRCRAVRWPVTNRRQVEPGRDSTPGCHFEFTNMQTSKHVGRSDYAGLLQGTVDKLDQVGIQFQVFNLNLQTYRQANMLAVVVCRSVRCSRNLQLAQSGLFNFSLTIYMNH